MTSAFKFLKSFSLFNMWPKPAECKEDEAA